MRSLGSAIAMPTSIVNTAAATHATEPRSACAPTE